MKKIFITGSSASGKSTLGEELKKRGFAVIGIDETIGSCNWYKCGTHEVENYHPGLGKEWLKNHEWICDFKQIEKKIDSYSDMKVVFVVGITTNQYDFLDKFDQVFLLKIDPDTLLHRLKNRTTNNFGKDASEQEFLLEINESFEKRMEDIGAIALDSTEPVKELADSVIQKI
jgi:broad-specificity NMP kinase